MFNKIAPYAKAVSAGAAAAIGSLVLVVTGNETIGDVSFAEWLMVGGNVLAVYGFTYAVPNKPKPQ